MYYKQSHRCRGQRNSRWSIPHAKVSMAVAELLLLLLLLVGKAAVLLLQIVYIQPPFAADGATWRRSQSRVDRRQFSCTGKSERRWDLVHLGPGSLLVVLLADFCQCEDSHTQIPSSYGTRRERRLLGTSRKLRKKKKGIWKAVPSSLFFRDFFHSILLAELGALRARARVAAAAMVVARHGGALAQSLFILHTFGLLFVMLPV